MVAIMADRQKPSAKVSGTVKKVTSSPSVRALGESENGDMSPADKKRNKLGYHRTAVACGHCRRRKIRCIPGPDSPTVSRCQNCIRLKKDCQFYPVDQNVISHPKKTRSESKGDILGVESEASASPPSPRTQHGTSALAFDHFRPSVDMNHVSQGPDQEYPHSYDTRPWFSSDHAQQPPWLQNDHYHQNSFVSTPYPISPITSIQPVTSHEHAYTYPALSLEQSQYPYSAHRPRDGPISPQSGPISTFNGYRSNTLPERTGLSEELQRNHDVHTTVANTSGQHMMGPPYSVVHGSPPQYTPPSTNQVWLPANSESQHQTAGFAPPGPSSTWYNHTGPTNDVREYNPSQTQLRDTNSQNSMRYRTKPG